VERLVRNVDGCKLKDLEKMGSDEDDDWGGLVSDGE
jgi:hypothetical protein